MIWLVVPTTWEGRPGAGQWKDLQGIRLVLARLGAAWKEFRFDGGNVGELAAQIGSAADVAIWYYTFWPEAMEELKRRCPQAGQAGSGAGCSTCRTMPLHTSSSVMQRATSPPWPVRILMAAPTCSDATAAVMALRTPAVSQVGCDPVGGSG